MSEDTAIDTSVRVEHLTKYFPGTREPVLNDLSMDFPAGKLTYVLGSSGAGKSVLLKHILGLLRPNHGRIWVAGKEITAMHPADLSEHRKVFGMLFQSAALFDSMSVYENVAFPLREHTNLSDEEIRDKVVRSLTLLGMPTGHQKLPNELSGGMKKRVALARAIIREPSILLYDEPTTGLDPVTRTTVDELIENLKRELKLTSIVISHDIPSALLLADQIAFLTSGKIVFSGKPEEFRKADHPLIQQFLAAEQRTVHALQQSQMLT